MHYVFDKWVERKLPGVAFCGYADDGLLHCKSLKQAEIILSMLVHRFKEVGLEIHRDKSHIVYCKLAWRQAKFNRTSFTFLCFDFCPRNSINSRGKVFLGF